MREYAEEKTVWIDTNPRREMRSALHRNARAAPTCSRLVVQKLCISLLAVVSTSVRRMRTSALRSRSDTGSSRRSFMS